MLRQFEAYLKAKGINATNTSLQDQDQILTRRKRSTETSIVDTLTEVEANKTYLFVFFLNMKILV